MRQILLVAIFAIASVFVGLSLVIIVNKAWRDARDRWRRGRRRVLEPLAEQLVRGEESPAQVPLTGRSEWSDRSVMEELLLERAQTAEGLERQRLSRAIDELGFVDDYLAALTHRSWWRRADAAEKLGLAVAGRTIDDLTAALEDEVSEVRFRAARALGRLGGISAMRPLIRALDKPNRWSTIRIADILASMGREVGDELTSAFASLGPRAKLAALDILASIGHLQIAPWLREHLRDEDPDVRARAANALGAVGDMDAGTILIEALGDPAWPVRAMAAKSLGVILHLPAVPDLCHAMHDPEWWVRVNAAEALRLLGPVGLNALKSILKDEDAFARHQAVLMLEEAGVVDEEVERLNHPAETERAAARSFVELVIRTDLLGRLDELAETHPQAGVREALARMLRADDDVIEAAS